MSEDAGLESALQMNMGGEGVPGYLSGFGEGVLLHIRGYTAIDTAVRGVTFTIARFSCTIIWLDVYR